MIERIHVSFPGLNSENTRITSPKDRSYNCIAWAAGDSRRFWWPGVDGYWPEGVLRDESVDAFTAAYEALGYSPCRDGAFEGGLREGRPVRRCARTADPCGTTGLPWPVDQQARSER